MDNTDFTQTFTVNASAAEAFASITRVREWWTENLEGHSARLNDEFTVRFGEVHTSTQKLTEVVPGQKLVWSVMDSHIHFVSDTHEWTGTEIHFGLTETGGQTQICFTHRGLQPRVECYGACSGAWAQYMQSLQQLINTGTGNPSRKE